MPFRVVVIGMGVQGEKRFQIARPDVVATVDPFKSGVDYENIYEVPLDTYDVALACVPDGVKPELLGYLLQNGKHVLVEKPLTNIKLGDLELLRHMRDASGAVCYTAYNHRFEPHFVRMKRLLESTELGRIYSVRMFYGNGTARLVRESRWRDEGAGVLPDLGSHLLDTLLFWFGYEQLRGDFSIRFARRFENRGFDHVALDFSGDMHIQLEMTLLMWRNHFTCDILAENGTAHISSLCKWGPSEFIHRTRILPSGRPTEITETLVQPDPTWAHEYSYFLDMIRRGEPGNLDTDIWLDARLSALSTEALECFP